MECKGKISEKNEVFSGIADNFKVVMLYFRKLKKIKKKYYETYICTFLQGTFSTCPFSWEKILIMETR